MAVTLSPDHGGCGATHARAVTHGAPSKQWALDCLPCENHLRSDPKWSTSIAEIPETPDEQRLRENREKLGQNNQQERLAEAIMTIAQSQRDLPANLAAAIALLTQQIAAPGAPQIEASNEDDPIVVESPKDEKLAAPEPGAEPEPDTTKVENEDTDTTDPEPVGQDYASMKLMDLRALAAEKKLDATGTRSELIDRLSSAR